MTYIKGSIVGLNQLENCDGGGGGNDDSVGDDDGNWSFTFLANKRNNFVGYDFHPRRQQYGSIYDYCEKLKKQLF